MSEVSEEETVSAAVQLVPVEPADGKNEQQPPQAVTEELLEKKTEKNVVALEEKKEAVSFDFATLFDSKTSNRGANTFEWRNLQVSINEQEIIKGVSGQLKDGELCAVLGASGAGKSTFLNVLSGRTGRNKKFKVQGDVSWNGVCVDTRDWRNNVSYVMQEPALFPTSTPREEIEFASLLRRVDVNGKAVDSIPANRLIECLGLTACQDVVVGTQLLKGLSGGEKTRTSIAVELASQPDILFLDEPTSGLDSYSAWTVMKLLKSLAQSGSSVMATLHQPSSEVLAFVDQLVLLADGRVVFHGTVDEALAYFAELGYPCPTTFNPADHFLFIIENLEVTGRTQLFDKWEQHSKPKVAEIEALQQSKAGEVMKSYKHVSATSFCTQLGALSKREALNKVRDKGSLIARLVITTFLSTLYALVFLDRGDVLGSDYDLRSHFGMIVNLSIGVMFSSAQPVLLTFPLERPVFLREYSSSMYSVVPYFISKTLSEMVQNAFFILLQVLISYWAMEFQGNFFYLCLIFWAESMVASSLAVLLGATTGDIKTASELVPLLFVPQILFSGIFVLVTLIPSYLRFAQWLCLLKFAVNLAAIEELSHARVDAQSTDAVDRFFDDQDIDEGLVGLYVGVLISLFVVFRLLAMTCLKHKALDVQ